MCLSCMFALLYSLETLLSVIIGTTGLIYMYRKGFNLLGHALLLTTNRKSHLKLTDPVEGHSYIKPLHLKVRAYRKTSRKGGNKFQTCLWPDCYWRQALIRGILLEAFFKFSIPIHPAYGHITDCKLVCMCWTRLVLVRPAASLYSASPLKHHPTGKEWCHNSDHYSDSEPARRSITLFCWALSRAAEPQILTSFVWRGRGSNHQPPTCQANAQPLHYPAVVWRLRAWQSMQMTVNIVLSCYIVTGSKPVSLLEDKQDQYIVYTHL